VSNSNRSRPRPITRCALLRFAALRNVDTCPTAADSGGRTAANHAVRFAAICCGLQRRHVFNRGRERRTAANHAVRFAAICCGVRDGNVDTCPIAADSGGPRPITRCGLLRCCG
jgi:hypothetical protein